MYTFEKFMKGDLLQVGTSEKVYTVTRDETKTGIVNCELDGKKFRFNSNRMDLNHYQKEED
jgi:hypothetical protein